MPSIEARSNSQMLMRNHFLPGTVEMMFGRRIVAPPENAIVTRAPYCSHGSTPVVGGCFLCRDQMRKQCKIRKSCVACRQPVYNKHSISKTMCVLCEKA